MDRDDDFQEFSPLEESSAVHARKLKRLKKATGVSSDDVVAKTVIGQVLGSSEVPESNEEPWLLESGNEFELGFTGASSEPERDFKFDENGEDLGGEKWGRFGHSKMDESIDSEGWNENSELSSRFDEDRPKTKRILEFDGNGEDASGETQEEIGVSKVGEYLDSEGQNEGSEKNHIVDEDRPKTKRALEFDGNGKDPNETMREQIEDLNMAGSERNWGNSEDLSQKRVKRKKFDGAADDGKPDAYASGRRMTSKERRACLNQLHAETQRLLRETRGAAFKSAKPVQKPISSILDKIRQRKLEVSKRTFNVNSSCSIVKRNNSLREIAVSLDLENEPKDKGGDDEFTKVVNDETVLQAADVPSISGGSIGSENHLRQGKTSLLMESDGKPELAFRAPIDDTQDLFRVSQVSDMNDELPNEQPDSPLEEVLGPSLLAMNLKLDSAPADDISSDEEDNNKENIDPDMHGPNELGSYPNGDPVKAFVDDEAEEEDDSDHDLLRFQDSEEDEDNGGSEELNDLIETEYEEKPIDGEKRNQLHQQWLEQQDAVGTDKLLQRLKCGTEQRETAMFEGEENGDGGESNGDEEEDSQEEEEFGDEALGLGPANLVRMNSRKIKQMIHQMFTDKDDGFVSDDEETEKRVLKQRLLKKAEAENYDLEQEEQAKLLSPEEDENSREVFGLIKKINNVPDAKRKAKTSSVLGMLLQGRNSNNSSKSSFLGRSSNQSLPSSLKPGSSMVRSFIFGREDSNSRSTVSLSEDSSDKIQKETRPKRTASAKFSSSQSKFSTSDVAVEKASATSLFEILRRPSLQTNNRPQDGATENQSLFAALRLTRKSIKVEGRT